MWSKDRKHWKSNHSDYVNNQCGQNNQCAQIGQSDQGGQVTHIRFIHGGGMCEVNDHLKGFLRAVLEQSHDVVEKLVRDVNLVTSVSEGG